MLVVVTNCCVDIDHIYKLATCTYVVMLIKKREGRNKVMASQARKGIQERNFTVK